MQIEFHRVNTFVKVRDWGEGGPHFGFRIPETKKPAFAG
jgi:hypothetical protein